MALLSCQEAAHLVRVMQNFLAKPHQFQGASRRGAEVHLRRHPERDVHVLQATAPQEDVLPAAINPHP